MPPLSWLASVLALSTRPTSKAPTQRATRTSPVSRSTCTSQKWAPDAARTQRRWSRSVRAMNRTCPAMARTPESAPTETSTWSCPVRARAAARGSPSRPPQRRTWRRIWVAASAMLPATLADCAEPPAPGAIGRSVSPYSTRTASYGTPSSSATTCACTVAVPMPISWNPHRSRAVPSASSRRVRLAMKIQAGWYARAIPYPTSVEPVCVGCLSCQPNSRAPRSMTSRIRRCEYARPCIGETAGSLRSRRSTGSIPRSCASWSIADSMANEPTDSPGARMAVLGTRSSSTTDVRSAMAGAS